MWASPPHLSRLGTVTTKRRLNRAGGAWAITLGGQGTAVIRRFEFILIEGVEKGNKKLLERREKYWQYQLRAFRENGGNAMSIR